MDLQSAHRLWQDQASKDRALQALSSMSSAQIVSATALQQVPGSCSGKSVLPPVLYPHMSPLGTPYSSYGTSGVSHSLQVTCTLHGVAFWLVGFYCAKYDVQCILLSLQAEVYEFKNILDLCHYQKLAIVRVKSHICCVVLLITVTVIVTITALQHHAVFQLVKN